MVGLIVVVVMTSSVSQHRLLLVKINRGVANHATGVHAITVRIFGHDNSIADRQKQKKVLSESGLRMHFQFSFLALDNQLNVHGGQPIG